MTPLATSPATEGLRPGVDLAGIRKTQIASPVQVQQLGQHAGGLLPADLILRPEGAIRVAAHKTGRKGRLDILGKPVLIAHILQGVFSLCSGRHLKGAIQHRHELGPGHSAIRPEVPSG